MAVLFDRVATLQVDTIVIRDLRFAFKVERSLRPSPGKAEVKIWNLNETHRGQLSALGAVSTKLDAGLGSSTSTIFVGSLRRVQHERVNGNTWITTVSGEDGGRERRQSRTTRSYRPGTPLRTVFQDLAADFGVGGGNLPQAIPGVALGTVGNTLATGTVLRGEVAQELDDLCRGAGLEWSVQNGVLQLLPRGQALAGTALVLGPDSGLVGSPAAAERGRVKFTALMIPDLAPGRLVRLASRVLQGQYRVDRCVWSGDTHGDAWHIEGEAAA